MPASNAPDHVVLGLAASGLKATAVRLNGRTLLGSADLVRDLRAAIANPATRFTIVLDGLAGGTPERQLLLAAQLGAAGPRGGYTNFEIAQLFRHRIIGEARLIRGHAPILNPFAT